MKINQNVTFLNAGAPPAPAKLGKPAASQYAAPAGPARQAAPASRLPSAGGDFDAARVAEIRESISAGRYQVNTARIADGLLSSVRDLLGKAPS